MIDPALGWIFGGCPWVPRTGAIVVAAELNPFWVCAQGIVHAECAVWPEYGAAWPARQPPPRWPRP